ncbi:MAG: PQQ-dependent sugar dehydrogenase [Pirellulales bacterium]|nr:PQQ-dependent sugar dehydrogenase [Pirellulales bacterium]
MWQNFFSAKFFGIRPRSSNRSTRPSRRRFTGIEPLETRIALAVLPAGFQETRIAGGLNPTSADFAPDGRLFLAEKGGRVRIIQNDVLLSENFYTVPVDTYRERGLDSIVLDPNFAQNGYVYIYYTPEVPGNPNVADNGTQAQLVRITADPNNPNRALAGSEVVIFGGIPSPSGIHIGGGMFFGNDGYLYIGVGDGLQSEIAQDQNSLRGKVLRLDVSTLPYQIPPDNPYVGQPNKRPEIYSSGVRNPFTLANDPVTGLKFVNDVGGGRFEEVNQIQPGANFGWPVVEGPSTNPLYVNPTYAYPHGDGGAAVTGGAFYNGTQFPASYRGTYFFPDFVQNVIRNLDPDTGNVTIFATDARALVDVDISANGSMYVLTKESNNQGVLKYTYTLGNRTPTAAFTANPTSGGVPLTVQFNGSGSSDPDGDALTYTWNFGDGTTGTGVTTSHTYNTLGTYNVTLTVNDRPGGTGLSNTSAPQAISVGNNMPVVSINTPAPTFRYTAGSTVSFSGSAVDAEDGVMPASSFTWSFLFGHNTHFHDFIPPIEGVSSASFEIPTIGEQDPDQYYRIILTVTDSSGLTGFKILDIRPATADLTLAAQPSGLTLSLDGETRTTPGTFTSVVGAERTVAAPATQVLGGNTYEFVQWSDGVTALSRTLNIAAAGNSLTAQYRSLGTVQATITSNRPSTWGTGATKNYNITLTNTGTINWTNSGPDRVQVAVGFGGFDDNPSTWTGTPQLFDVPATAVGQTVVVNVNVVAPNVPNGYILRHRLVRASGEYLSSMERRNATVTIPTLAATYAGTVPTVWSNLQSPSYNVTVTNTGTETWLATGTNRVRLGVYFGGYSDAPNAWNTEPQRVVLPNNVAPGQSVTLTVRPNVPTSGGISPATGSPGGENFILRARLVKEGVGWFDYLQKTDVVVQTFIAAHSSSAPTSVPLGQSVTYPVTITNTGKSLWNATGANPVKLGVYLGGIDDNPDLAIGGVQRITLPADVPAGQSITINVTLPATTMANGYVLRHRMVREGISWFKEMERLNFSVTTVGTSSASYTNTATGVWGTGSTRSYTVTVTNTGTTSWSAGGANPTRLGAYFGGLNEDPAAAIGDVQYFSLPNNVAPGQSATITVNMVGPSIANGYILRHRMITGASMWFDQIQALNATVNVPTLAATYAGSVPATWTNLQGQSYSVTLTNTGTQTWNATGNNPVRLGVYFAGESDAPNSWPIEPKRISLPNDVAPGQSVTVTVQPNVPGTVGNYPFLRTRLVKEGVSWFDYLQKTPVTVQINTAAYGGTTPTTWAPNQARTYAVSLTNTGNTTWNATGTNPYRLGVYFGGASDAVGAWTAEPVRITLPRDVLPGETISVNVTHAAPATPGSYTIRQRMVRDGIGWFGQMQRTNVTVQ